MTDLEMDLMIAQAENAKLKKTIAMLMGKKCNFGVGVTVKPDGINELDPCIYEVKEIHTSVTVYVRQCPKCGSIDISWERQEDTEDIMEGDLDG